MPETSLHGLYFYGFHPRRFFWFRNFAKRNFAIFLNLTYRKKQSQGAMVLTGWIFIIFSDYDLVAWSMQNQEVSYGGIVR